MTDAGTKLSAQALEELRLRLGQELEQIRTELDALQQGTPELTLDQTSVGRLSRMDAMQQHAMSSGIRERILLRRRRVEAALARLEAQTYGTCCECGIPLSLQRLTSDPSAPFCTECQEEIDERRRAR